MRELIEEHGLTHIADEIMNDVKPCIRLKLDYAADETIPIGVSKMGGSPDVPADFQWPMWNDVPLTFIAQIRFSDAKPFDQEDLLPAQGLLYFFFGIDAYLDLPYEKTQGNSGPYEAFHVKDEQIPLVRICLLYTSDAADEEDSVDL